MLHSPKISVIIPVYNAGKFLRACLNSLRRQSFRDYEAILVNDGSADNSLSILREYESMDPRFRVYDFPNGGYGKAMNRGMLAATGQYMAILEPDDMLPEKAYENLWKAAESYEFPDIVRGEYLTMYEKEGKMRYEHIVNNYLCHKSYCPRKEYYAFKCTPSTWTSLYRMDFLRRHGLKHNETPGASFQDEGWFTLTLCLADKWVCIDSIVYLYRIDNPNSSVRNYDTKIGTLFREYNYIKNILYRTPGLWEEVKVGVFTRFVNAHVYVYEMLSDHLIGEFVQKLKAEIEKIFSDIQDKIPEWNRDKWTWILTQNSKYPIQQQTKTPARHKKLWGFLSYKIERKPNMIQLESGIKYAGGYREVRSFWGIPFSVKHRKG